MRRDPSKVVGTIVADETCIGGDPQNRHYYDRQKNKHAGKTDKIPVLTIIDSKSGEARSQVVADVTGRSLRRVISEKVEMAQLALHADSWNGYTTLGQEFSDHQAVDHRVGEYVRHG